jgi:hypothetical protein
MEAARVTQAIYLYGFTPADTMLPTYGLSGTADAVVELFSYGSFQAAIARVPADEYDPSVLEDRLKDLPWVAAQGVAHERVVAWFVDHAQILPVPLFTMYSSEELLHEEVRRRADAIVAKLERFVGLREWDLKVSYRHAQAETNAALLSPDIAMLDDEIARSTPGRRFLLEKKRADLLKTEVSRAAALAASELIEALRPLAREVKVAPLAPAPGELPVIANAALLVAMEAELEMRERVRERTDALRPAGIDVVYSGPWAPYRFIDNES